MKLVSVNISGNKDSVLSLLRSYDNINSDVQFDDKIGRPTFRFRQKGSWLTVDCRMVGGPSRDNGFLIGTVFLGRIKEKGDYTSIKGVITTAPVYHLGLLGLSAFYIYKCIELGGFNPIPPILLIFSLFLFKNEFKKQGIISRYFKRAERKINSGDVK